MELYYYVGKVMSPLLKRVIAGMGANAYGQAVTIIIQLVSLPLFLTYWDLETYGIWLILSAIPSYISMADVGMVTVAGNRMTMLMEQHKQSEANHVFQSAQLFVFLSCFIVALTILPIIAFAPIGILNPGSRIALMLLMVGVLLTLVSSLAGAIFRATHRYAIGASLDVTARLLEWLGGIVGLFVSGSFYAVALGMLIMRTVAAGTTCYISCKGSSNLYWGIKESSKEEIKRMIKPSLGFMAFPIGNALTFQGFTLLCAYLLNPASAAIFNIYRVIARVSVQATSILSHALWPEFSRLYGNQNIPLLKSVFFRSAKIGLIGAVSLSFVIYFAAPFFLKIWTHGKIEYIPSLMTLILVYASLSGTLHAPRVLLMATNNHSKLGVIYLVISALSLVIAYPLGKFIEISGLALSMIIGEACMVIACVYMSLKIINIKKDYA